MLSVKQRGIKYHFLIFSMTRPVIDHQSPGPLVNTLTIIPMGRENIQQEKYPTRENIQQEKYPTRKISMEEKYAKTKFS